MRVTNDWLAFVRENVRADFETGELWWIVPKKGRNLYKPLGCMDSNGYVKVSIGNRATYAHSVVFFLFYGKWPDMLDHVDQDRANNSITNLMETDHSRNGLNAKVWTTNTSGVKGASITPFGNYKVSKAGTYLGTFKTKQEAEDAYNRHCPS